MNESLDDAFEVFPWNTNFETKISLIDEQHKKLVSLLNQLASHLANQSSSIELSSVFDELADYADYHFQSEEVIWQQHFINDPCFSSHQKTHRSFMQKVLELKNEKKPLDNIVSDIIRFLTNWLAFHILDTDRRMALTVRAMETGMSIDDAKNHADVTMSGSIEVLIDTVMMMYDSLSVRTIELMREKAARLRAEEALKINEERWTFVMESSGDEIWDWDIAKGDIHRTENLPAILDCFIDAETNLKKTSCVHPDDLIRVKRDLQSHIDAKTDCFVNEHRVMYDDGTCYWVLTRGKIISRDAGGQPLRMIGTHINITEREISSLLYQNSSEGMMVTDADNNIITVNSAFTVITGYSLEEVVGKTPKILRSGRHDQDFFRSMWESIENTGQWQGEIWNRRKDGSVFPEWLTINNIYNPDKTVHYRFGLFDDITERKVGEEIIWKQANFDPLTGLPNRQNLYDRLTLELKKAHRGHNKLALLFIDLDLFKEVNDSLGHLTGDQLLVEVGKRLKSCVRESDTVARISGDEFTIILSSINENGIIERVAQNILEKLKSPFSIDTDVLHISASIGITLYPDDSIDRESLLRNADQAMYQAKKNGRNCFAFFTQALQDAAQNRMCIAKELRSALRNNEFQLLYQPIVDLGTGEIHKAEALIRWQHPDRGLVSPDNFISIAEETGVIQDIGNWVFFEAAQQVAKWRTAYSPNFQISINKSPVQFRLDKDKHESWFDYLKKQDLTGDSIIVEITEGLLLESNESVQHQLDQFSLAGMQISLDDFGTGFSSLAYLQEFDIDYVKIDKSFIQSLTPTSRNLALCKAIIMMAHALDMKVVAEGIETEEQKNLLSSLECDYGQGYLFSKPIAAKAFEKMIEQ